MWNSHDGGGLLQATAQAVETLGQNEFYDSLLGMLGGVVRHDLAALVRYSRSSPPDLIIPRIEPTETIMSYYRDFFAFDPFFAHWATGGDVGVYRLRAMASNIGHSRYAREFLSPMAIHDEIAVYLPPIGEASPTLILDRSRGAFTREEVQRVRNLFPLLAALHRRHLSIFVTAGIDLSASPIGNERPLRLVDHNGRQIFATQAWAAIIDGAERAIAEAVATVTDRGPCLVRLPDSRSLRRTQLPPDFGPAPGGYCDEITPSETTGTNPAMLTLPDSLADQLTEREQDVVLLTLRGYPAIEIARKLGLSRGTVKNYRLNIYRKLDITTERELFGQYMRAVSGAA